MTAPMTPTDEQLREQFVNKNWHELAIELLAARARLRELEGAVELARSWLPRCSGNAIMQKDLETIDAAALAQPAESRPHVVTADESHVLHEAILASSEIVDPGQPVESVRRVRHKKRGSTYRVIGTAIVQTSQSLGDDEPVVVYQCEADGQLWARAAIEFHDGRFEDLPLQPAESGGMEARFKPCVTVDHDMGLTTCLFEDVANSAVPLDARVPHFIDKLVAWDDGRVVGMQVWMSKPPTPSPREQSGAGEELAHAIAIQYAIIDFEDRCANDIIAALHQARAAGMEAAAVIAEAWLKRGEMELRAGEMTAQEKRTVRAIVTNIVDTIRREAKP